VVSLGWTSVGVGVVSGISLGVLAAWKVGTWIDRLVMVLSVLSFSVPVFVVGYLLIYVFSIKLGWLPVQGYAPIADGFDTWIRHLILPSPPPGLPFLTLLPPLPP